MSTLDGVDEPAIQFDRVPQDLPAHNAMIPLGFREIGDRDCDVDPAKRRGLYPRAKQVPRAKGNSMRQTLAGLVLTVLVVACGGSSDPNTAAYWIERLEKKETRVEALKKLGDLKDKSAIPAVLEYLGKEGEWQPDAAFALGQLGDPAVVPQLVAKIDFGAGGGADKTTRIKNRVNQNVVRALAMLKAPEGVDPMVKLINAADDRTREAAMMALGDMGDKRATEPLVQVATTDRAPFMRRVAITSLGALADAKAAPALIKMLFVEIPGASFYNEARFALIQIGQPAVPKLLETLRRENKEIEEIRMGDGSPVAPGAVEAKISSVLGALRVKDAEPIMLKALETHYKSFQGREKEPVHAAVLGAIIEVAYALGNIGTDTGLKALIALAKDPEINVRIATSEALTTLGSPTAVPALLEAAKTGELDSKRAALSAASRLGTGDHLAAFDALGKDATLAPFVQAERVRLVAASECKAELACWKKKLEDADPKVRERAAYQLGWLGAKDASAELLKAAQDNDAFVRMGAVLSIDRLGNTDPAALQAVYDAGKNRMEFRAVNSEIQRIVASLKARSRK